MAFQPTVGEALAIEGIEYRIAEHPAAPGMPYGQEGRQAVVYQLVADNACRALKVFKPTYRIPGLVALARQLEEYAALPGLDVCKRTVLTGHRNKSLLREYPDLTYAVLMPWIEGPTWMQVLLEKRALTPEQSLQLARAFVDVLATMEEHGLAHCDLSGPNVMLPLLAGANGIALVDVEQMYGPELRRPRSLPGGSLGYAHRTAPEGLWSEDADRFGGAVLIAEILGWCDERVREAAWGENYFDQQELQRDCDRYRLLAEVLKERWGDRVSRLFERAWRAETLTQCATLGEWLVVFPEAVPERVRAGKPVQKVSQRAGQGSDADSIQAWMELGRRFEGQGRLENALETYRQAHAHADEGSGLRAELALIIAELEAKSKAAEDGASVDQVATLFREGLAACEHQEWPKAVELLSEVVRHRRHYEQAGHRASDLLAQAERKVAHRRSRMPIATLAVLAVSTLAVMLAYRHLQQTARIQATETAPAAGTVVALRSTQQASSTALSQQTAAAAATSRQLEMPTPTPIRTAAATDQRPEMPTPTAIPAALVNGQSILVDAYELRVNLALNSLSQDRSFDTDTEEGRVALRQLGRQVLDCMIDETLVEQAAAREGVYVSEEQVEAEMARLVGEDVTGFENWLEASHLTHDSFRAQLKYQLLAAALAGYAGDSQVEQAHARHILLGTEAEAMEVILKLRSGESFANLAKQYSQDQASRDSGGDLGFFPRGVMPAEIEMVAFTLAPGQTSGIVKTDFGYHVIEVIEKEPSREVPDEMLLAWREGLLKRWVEAERSSADIEHLISFE